MLRRWSICNHVRSNLSLEFMMRPVIIICLLLFSLCDCTAQLLIEVKDNKVNNIGKQVDLLVDTSGRLSIEEIASTGYEHNFTRSNQRVPSLGVITSPAWCRLKIRNYTNQKLALAVNNTEIEFVDLYYLKEGVFQQKRLSAYEPFNARELALTKYFFLLDIPKDSTQVFYLRLQTSTGLQFPLLVSTFQGLIETEEPVIILYGFYIGIMLTMILYNLFIYFSIRDRSYIFYILYVAFITLTNVIEKGVAFRYLWPSMPSLNQYGNIAACLTGIFAIYFSISFLHLAKHSTKFRLILNGIAALYLVAMAVILTRHRLTGMVMTEVISIFGTLFLFAAGFAVYRKGYTPAKYYLIAWSVLLIGVIVFVFKDFNIVPYNNLTVNGMTIGSAIEAMLLSFALGNRIKIYKDEKDRAQQIALQSLEEKKQFVLEQNILLESKVNERTEALKKANEHLTTANKELQSTQAQLIQSEKMASLGELTAGIAHEIQNPLNFINNFSDVNKELIIEVKHALKNGNKDEATLIVNDIDENEQKINNHGKRADAIVKSMLQHSRKSTGEKVPVDINALADEYLRLAYQGFRAKDKSFNATLHTQFDNSIGKIAAVPQDLGRVLLNLYNNALYAVNEKKLTLHDPIGYSDPNVYVPTVTVATTLNQLSGEKVAVLISVKDNGVGIPQKVVDKIFQPFFTTKPSGQGTGLGLSLSYDIIKSHAGKIRVETKEGEGAEFVIELPVD
jgi:two-component system NtrC family sensor kinase